MIFSVLFIIASWLTGLAAVSLFKVSQINTQIRNLLALLVGLVLNSLVSFSIGALLGFSFLTVISSASILALASFIILLYKKEPFRFAEDLSIQRNKMITLCFIAFSLLISLMFLNSIFFNKEGIIAGNRIVWTDWPIHIGLISSFAYGNNFPAQNPFYSNTLLSYPFLSDFLSSIFVVLGSSLKFALIIPGIILSFIFVALLFYFGLLLTGNKKESILGVFIGLFWGGMGFYYFLKDLISSPTLETLFFPPHEYTFFQEKNLWFFSFLYSELLPQRAFLFGLPIFFAALILILTYIKNSNKLPLLLAALLIGILPIFHMHSFISMFFLLAAFLPMYMFRVLKTKSLKFFKEKIFDLIFFLFLPVVGLFLIQYPFLSPVNLDQTIGWHLGWMMQGENIFVFWFKNTGIFWPLLLFAFFKSRLTHTSRYLILASFSLFIIPNLFRFAPWPYDNLKIFTYWYFISAFLVSHLIVKIFRQNLTLKFLSVVIVFSLVASGIIEISRLSNLQRNKIPLWSKADIETSNVILENTAPESVIAAAAIHNHPITGLAGRKMIIGFPGNAWSWGLPDWKQREEDVHKIFQGNSNTPFLLQKYNVSYIFISNVERFFEPQLNESYFETNFELAIANQNFRLYKVK